MSHASPTATAVHGHHEATGFFRTYLYSTDHKMIAKQYLLLGLFMAVVGGYLSYAMRWQLAWPDTEIPGFGFLGPETYNALVTNHGTIMVFFVAMPILLGSFGRSWSSSWRCRSCSARSVTS